MVWDSTGILLPQQITMVENKSELAFVILLDNAEPKKPKWMRKLEIKWIREDSFSTMLFPYHLLEWRANARNVSFTNSLRWPLSTQLNKNQIIYILKQSHSPKGNLLFLPLFLSPRTFCIMKHGLCRNLKLTSFDRLFFLCHRISELIVVINCNIT